MGWNLAGIFLGPALSALRVRINGSYTQTFTWLTVFGLAGFALSIQARLHARRDVAP